MSMETTDAGEYGRMAKLLHRRAITRDAVSQAVRVFDCPTRINFANQQIAEFADRFESAQKKLQTYVPHEQTAAYLESIRAYKEADLSSDIADDDDVKSKGLALHF